MEEILITEEELEYLTNVPDAVCDPAVPYKAKKSSFEEEAKGCITLEEFSILLDEAIMKLIREKKNEKNLLQK